MQAGAVDFEAIWSRQIASVELPNRRGAGTSCVGIVEAGDWPQLCAGRRVYVKRQQRFFCRPVWNGFRPTPTLRREIRFLEQARALGIPVPSVVRYQEGSQRPRDIGPGGDRRRCRAPTSNRRGAGLATAHDLRKCR